MLKLQTACALVQLKNRDTPRVEVFYLAKWRSAPGCVRFGGWVERALRVRQLEYNRIKPWCRKAESNPQRAEARRVLRPMDQSQNSIASLAIQA
jgi:hypothetical protein